MALLGMFGFDDLVLVEPGTTRPGAAVGRVSPSLCATYNSVAQANLVQLSSPNTNTVYFGAAFNFSVLATFGLIYMVDSGGNVHITIRVNTNGSLDILGPTGSVVASAAAGTVAANIWYYFEVKVLVADSGGIAELRIDQT